MRPIVAGSAERDNVEQISQRPSACRVVPVPGLSDHRRPSALLAALVHAKLEALLTVSLEPSGPLVRYGLESASLERTSAFHGE